MTPDDLRTLAELRRQRAMKRQGRPSARKRLYDLELDEISIVTVPANPGAHQTFYKALHHIEKSEAPALSQEAVAALVREVVAENMAELAAGVARVEAAAQRTTAGGGGGDAGSTAPAAVVAEALRAARAGEDRPPAFWRTALRHLGEMQAPDVSPLQQQHAALAHPDGHALVRALTGAR